MSSFNLLKDSSSCLTRLSNATCICPSSLVAESSFQTHGQFWPEPRLTWQPMTSLKLVQFDLKNELYENWLSRNQFDSSLWHQQQSTKNDHNKAALKKTRQVSMLKEIDRVYTVLKLKQIYSKFFLSEFFKSWIFTEYLLNIHWVLDSCAWHPETFHFSMPVGSWHAMVCSKYFILICQLVAGMQLYVVSISF